MFEDLDDLQAPVLGHQHREAIAAHATRLRQRSRRQRFAVGSAAAVVAVLGLGVALAGGGTDAFARTFELPVTWFFMPPPPWASPGVPVKLRTPDAERFGTQLALLADLVFGNELDAAHLAMRLDAFFQQLGTNPLSDAQQRVVDAVNTRRATLVEHAVGDLQTWQTQLRALANHLEDLEARSRRLE